MGGKVGLAKVGEGYIGAMVGMLEGRDGEIEGREGLQGWVGEGGQTGGTMVDTGGLTDSPETRAIFHEKFLKEVTIKVT